MTTVLSANEGNLLLKKKIQLNEVFIASKMGDVEQIILNAYSNSKLFSLSIKGIATERAGITPPTDLILSFFCQEYSTALNSIDIMGLWYKPYEESLIQKYCKRNLILTELRFLEPFYFDDPWSKGLRGLNVLVIHPFEESIKEQYEKRLKLFKDFNILPEFNLMILKAEQTNRGGFEHNKPWPESLNIMKEKIDRFNFDIALIGCGAYGLLLAEYIKINKRKPSIHIGGGLQILFGIKGHRWDKHEDISKLFNEHWIRPKKSETPKNVELCEDRCYW